MTIGLFILGISLFVKWGFIDPPPDIYFDTYYIENRIDVSTRSEITEQMISEILSLKGVSHIKRMGKYKIKIIKGELFLFSEINDSLRMVLNNAQKRGGI